MTTVHLSVMTIPNHDGTRALIHAAEQTAAGTPASHTVCGYFNTEGMGVVSGRPVNCPMCQSELEDVGVLSPELVITYDTPQRVLLGEKYRLEKEMAVLREHLSLVQMRVARLNMKIAQKQVSINYANRALMDRRHEERGE